MRGRNMLGECINARQHFFLQLKAFSPRVIVFCGSTLLHALNSAECIYEAERILGPSRTRASLSKDMWEHGRRLKPFKVGLQCFERCQVIAVPHPTGSIGISYSYIAAFREEIRPILQSYRQQLEAIEPVELNGGHSRG